MVVWHIQKKFSGVSSPAMKHNIQSRQSNLTILMQPSVSTAGLEL